MSAILQIDGLCKTYPSFWLEDVSFSVEAGKIMGFIGRNGAGKTTTLKSLMNLVHPDRGSIEYFGLPMGAHEREIKQRIGFASGGINYYPRKRMRDIVAVTRQFFDNWDDGEYRRYLQRFSLDEEKRPIELSEGMKVKFNLAIALSHHAELLLLDEPTSGLDPVSRDDLLEVFLDLAAEGVAILFSTHITSDLDKCADGITYIRNGKILASQSRENFINSYRVVNIPGEGAGARGAELIGISRSRDGDTGLIAAAAESAFSGWEPRLPDLETIMVHLEKEAEA